MPFNVNKCHILQVETRNKKIYEYEISGVKLDSVQCVKNLGVTITSNLKILPALQRGYEQSQQNAGLYKQKIFLQE